jgi:hypothetical protein
MYAKQSDQTYLWTLFRLHIEPAMGFGHLAELAAWLDSQYLPGIVPSAWIVDVCLEEGESGHFGYTHDADGTHEWKIIIAPAAHRETAKQWVKQNERRRLF